VAELLGPHRRPQPGLSRSPTEPRRGEDGDTTDPPARLHGDGRESGARRNGRAARAGSESGAASPLRARSPTRPSLPGPREAAPRPRERCEDCREAAAAAPVSMQRERSSALKQQQQQQSCVLSVYNFPNAVGSFLNVPQAGDG